MAGLAVTRTASAKALRARRPRVIGD
jgi:hypothetical protein